MRPSGPEKKCNTRGNNTNLKGIKILVYLSAINCMRCFFFQIEGAISIVAKVCYRYYKFISTRGRFYLFDGGVVRPCVMMT